MGILTIRNLDDEVHRKLRIAAAERGLSMEEHVRQVLARAIREPAAVVAEPGAAYEAEREEKTAGQTWLEHFRAIWAEVGYAEDLVIPLREPSPRPVPFVDDDEV